MLGYWSVQIVNCFFFISIALYRALTVRQILPMTSQICAQFINNPYTTMICITQLGLTHTAEQSNPDSKKPQYTRRMNLAEHSHHQN